jgi:hypothetical protein
VTDVFSGKNTHQTILYKNKELKKSIKTVVRVFKLYRPVSKPLSPLKLIVNRYIYRERDVQM